MKRILLSATLLALCLTACSQSPQPAATPSPAPGPSPAPTATSSPEPTPTEEPKELWGFPIDDTHDAFEVPTGGKRGTMLVTVEIENEDAEEFQFSVWAADNLEHPIQTMTAERFSMLHWCNTIDANFDGYMDFGYMYAMGNQPAYYHYWIWDEEQGLFVAEPEFDQISWPQFDEETGIISGWNRNSCCSGIETYHHWENGKLVCFRKVEYTYPDENQNQEKVVYERVDGELVEISREPYEMRG